LGQFDITKTEKRAVLDEYELRIEFREKESMVSRSGLVQKGYYNPIEIIDFPVSGMGVYLKFYRRRWKDLDTGEEYGNEYEIRFPGTKIRKRFGLFLKEEDRDKVYQLLSVVPYLHDTIEEDILVVQKSSLKI